MDFSLILCGEKNFYRTAIKTAEKSTPKPFSMGLQAYFF